MRRGPHLSPWNLLWLVLAGLYFLVPLYGTAEFSLETTPGHHGFDAYQAVLEQSQFWSMFSLSLEIAIGTVVISLVLMLPTVYWVHLKLPRIRPVLDFIAVLPFVVPPVTLAVGILRLFGAGSQQTSGIGNVVIGQPSSWLLSGSVFDLPAGIQLLALAYVILALPFTYRSLEAGMRAIDLRTLTEAAQSLGAGWLRVLAWIILPNMRSAMLSAAFLTLTLVMGEYTMASLMLLNTFPIYMFQIGNEQAYQAAALAMISLILTWVALLGVLVLGRTGKGREVQIGGAR
jgi:putative spermidine/putrescine transport system permease protein